ncbi:hypothetical protein PYCC9005_000773 [Savitreella phatthalungensis]
MTSAEVVSNDSASMLDTAAMLDNAQLRDTEAFMRQLEHCFPGYREFSFLYASNQLYALRCASSDTGQRIFIKAAFDLSHLDAVQKLRNEWRCQLATFDIVGIKKAFAIGPCNDEQGLALFYHDDGELTSLAWFDRTSVSPDYLSHPGQNSHPGPADVDLNKFIDFAIAIVAILRRLHAKGMIHGQISPESLGVDCDGRAMLFDLSCCTFLEREESQPTVIATRQLPFMSPESSGRINRTVDHRSDFYSLGVTFYYLLSHQLPFTGATALELMYKHIAQPAQPLARISNSTPPALSDMVELLMAKSPEDRYQSADGILSDLKVLQRAASEKTLLVIQDFVPGTTDTASRFRIPQRLVGRETEAKQIRDLFEEVRRSGGCKVTIVKGPSGSGKSSLVHEITGAILESRSFYTSGKFDQYRRGVPFFSLIQAGAGLVRQVLCEDDRQLIEWRDLIFEAIGENIAVVFDVLPELEKMFGPDFVPPDVPDLGPVEREKRFSDAFIEFLLCFGRRGAPLVLSIDDVQWASVGELNLIGSLAGRAAISSNHALHLFIAYRDNEVLDDHHTHVMLRTMQETNVSIDVVEINSLSAQHVRELLIGTLRYKHENSMPELDTLAQLIVAKTDGNAFFVTQILKTFHDRGLIFYSFERFRWEFDLPAILRDNLPVSVVDLLAAQILKLSEDSRNCLKSAACLGSNRFSLSLLAVVTQRSVKRVGGDLWEALRTGLILPTSTGFATASTLELFDRRRTVARRPSYETDSLSESTRGLALSVSESSVGDIEVTYRFLHDRVQQAAYQLVAEADRPAMHLEIGTRMYNAFAAQQALETYCFEIADQINRGIDLITSPTRLAAIIDLNVMAGKRALQSTAFDAALTYLSTARHKSPTEWWSSRFEYQLEIALFYIDALYANHDYEAAVRQLHELKERARNPMERAQIMFRMINVYMGLDAITKALEVGIAALDLLDFHVPLDKHKANSAFEELRPQLDLTPSRIDSLGELPICHDPKILLVQSLASTVLLPIYLQRPDLLPLLCALSVLTTKKHGITQTGAYPLTMYGVTIFVADNSPSVREQSYHYGHTAVKIVDRTANLGLASTTTAVLKVFASHLCYWNQPMRDCLVYFNSAIATGVKTFNVEYTCYAYVESCTYSFWAGEPLPSVVSRMLGYLPFVRNVNQRQSLWYMTIQLQAFVNYMTEGADQFSMDGEYFSVALEWDQVVATNAAPQFLIFYLYKLMTAVYFGYPLGTCLQLSDQIEKYSLGTQGVVYIAKWSFLICSALSRNYNGLTPEQLAIFDLHLGRLRRWTTGCPSSLLHIVLYLEATLLAQDDRELDAYQKFEDAYDTAIENGNVHEAGHIAERAGIWLSDRNKRIATRFLLASWDCFKVFGWNAKLKHLESSYPDVFRKEDLDNRPLEKIMPFRPVNMKMNHDGTLSKLTPGSQSPQRLSTDAHRGDPRATSHHGTERNDERDRLSDITIEQAGNSIGTRESIVSAASSDRPATAIANQRYREEMSRRLASETSTRSPVESATTNTLHDGEKGKASAARNMPPMSRLSTRGSQSTRLTSSGETNSGGQSAPAGDDSSRSGGLTVEGGLDFDLEVALRASVLISDVLQVSDVLRRLVESVLTNAGADYGALLLLDEGTPFIEATGRNGCVEIVPHQPLSLQSEIVPASMVNFVLRLRENIVLGDATSIQKKYANDPYFRARRPRSVMCMPVQNTLKLVGILYLENSMTAHAFGSRRIELLNFLCTQAAIAIEKARLYSDLEVAKDEAQASNRMKSEFLSTISHEIRTPFNAVLGMSGFLLDTKLTPMQTDYVETIRNSSRELLRVIDDILDFSKMEHGSFELHKDKFGLRELVESAMQVTAERASAKKLELGYFNLHHDFPDVIFNDATRFRQVIINLLGNAIKFTEHGSITIFSQATMLRPGGEGDSASSRPSYRIHISVKDTGIGIREEDHQKLFKLFSQIDSSLARSFTGTGLGLAISEKLVRLMGGKIWVESQPGVGSTFHFTIVTDVIDREQPAPPPLKQNLRDRNVVILDDNEVAIKSLKDTLTWLGMVPTAAQQTDEFLQIVRRAPPGTFPLALIEQQDDAEIDVIHELDKHDPGCRVVLLCRFGAAQKAANDRIPFLIKPVKRERLMRVVAEILAPHAAAKSLEQPGASALNNLVEDERDGRSGQRFEMSQLGTVHPLRILLAEDNMINSRVALQHLKRMGYTDVVHAKDGQQTVEEEDKRDFDVILMDVQMPRLDGIAATRVIRRKYDASPDKTCPHIVAMTANAMRGDRERCMEAGMHAYCAKPIMPEALARCLLDAPSAAQAATGSNAEDHEYEQQQRRQNK